MHFQAESRDHRSSAAAPHTSESVLKFPVLFDIFSLLSSRCPLHLKALGFICWLGHMAVWLYRLKVKWF
jgi:hypothetical protein